MSARADLIDVFVCESCGRTSPELGRCEHANLCPACVPDCARCEAEGGREGFFDGIPDADYHADRTSLSHSGIKTLLKQSPRKFQYRLDNPEHKDVFDFGSAAHRLVLGVGPGIASVAADSWRTKVAQERRDALRANGFIPLLQADYNRVVDMDYELKSHKLAMQLLTDGRPEVSAYATDEATGVMRRCRYDYLHDDLAVDYKTAASSEPTEFKWAAKRYGYHAQAAYYSDIAETLGRPLRGFLFVVQEKEPPYIVTVIQLPAYLVDEGRAMNALGLEMFRDCTAAGSWPGYVPDDQIAMPD